MKQKSPRLQPPLSIRRIVTLVQKAVTMATALLFPTIEEGDQDEREKVEEPLTNDLIELKEPQKKAKTAHTKTINRMQTSAAGTNSVEILKNDQRELLTSASRSRSTRRS